MAGQTTRRHAKTPPGTSCSPRSPSGLSLDQIWSFSGLRASKCVDKLQSSTAPLLAVWTGCFILKAAQSRTAEYSWWSRAVGSDPYRD